MNSTAQAAAIGDTLQALALQVEALAQGGELRAWQCGVVQSIAGALRYFAQALAGAFDPAELRPEVER